MSVILLDHVSYSADDNTVRNFSFNFYKPSIYAMLGASTSGIKALYGLLSGQLDPQEGHVWLDGEELKQTNFSYKICYISEDTIFSNSQNILDIFSQMAKRYLKWDNALAMHICEMFNINIHTSFGHLSTRDKSLLYSGIALASNANITLFNLAFNEVDPKDRYDFFNLLYTQHEYYPRIFILTSPYIDDVADILDEILMIHNGKLLEIFTPEAIANNFTYLSGKSEVLKGLISDIKVISYEERKGTLTVCLPKRLTKDEIRKYQKYMIKMSQVPIEKVFIYLIALRSKKDAEI